MEDKQRTILKKRLEEMKENFDNLPALEKLYFDVAWDYGFLNDELIGHLQTCRNKKNDIKKQELKSVAQFDRAFEETDEALILKSYKYQINALSKMNAGIRVRIEGLKTELINPNITL